MLQALTAALISFSSFAAECSTIGLVRALFNCLSLPQQLTNCSSQLTQTLAAVGTVGLQAIPDFQEDIQQLARQLSRCCSGCPYSRGQYELLFELHEQVRWQSVASAAALTLTSQLVAQVMEVAGAGANAFMCRVLGFLSLL